MLTRPDNDEDEIDDDQIEDSIADDEGKSLISNFGYVLNLPAFFFCEMRMLPSTIRYWTITGYFPTKTAVPSE